MLAFSMIVGTHTGENRKGRADALHRRKGFGTPLCIIPVSPVCRKARGITS